MEKGQSQKGVICFTNPEQFPFILQKGIYGNVKEGDKPKNPSDGRSVAAARDVRFGKLEDLLCVVPGDLVFLFERGESRLHGVWKVSQEPFYCTSQVFDPSDDYPYRFYMEWYLKFPNPVPVMELRKLLNKNVLWSIRTFEREFNAPFASINPISLKETEALLELFWRYNHRFDPSSNVVLYNHPSPQGSINFHDLVMNSVYKQHTPLRITANDFGQSFQGEIYEGALHCYLIYGLVRGLKPVREYFGEYRQVLREVPISVAGQKRPDILLIYQNAMSGEPSVYSIMEVKRSRVDLDMLSQLLEYIRLFSERHGVDLNSVEGIYIGPDFKPDALEYVRERAKVEVERPLRIIKYGVTGNKINLSEEQ
jgi:hypothetical protein